MKKTPLVILAVSCLLLVVSQTGCGTTTSDTTTTTTTTTVATTSTTTTTETTTSTTTTTTSTTTTTNFWQAYNPMIQGLKRYYTYFKIENGTCYPDGLITEEVRGPITVPGTTTEAIEVLISEYSWDNDAGAYVTSVTSEYEVVTPTIDMMYTEDVLGAGALVSFIKHQFPAIVGDTWISAVMADGQQPSTAEVISTSESVTVAAGTYTNVIHVRHTANGTITFMSVPGCGLSQTMESWNASGVGPIKTDSQTLLDIPGYGQLSMSQSQEAYQIVMP